MYTYHIFDAGAVICLCSFVPYITQLAPVATGELDWMHELGGLEPSGAYEQVVVGFHHIGLTILANNADTVGANAMNRSGLKSNVRQSESGIVVI